MDTEADIAGSHRREHNVIPTFQEYQRISADMGRALETVATRPMEARETEYYRANIGAVKSIDEFLADRRLYSYAMKAFGLQEMTYATAYMRKVLESGVDDPDGFTRQLNDPRFREFAETFNFVRYGDATMAFSRTQSGTIDRYLQQTLEEVAGQTNEGVRLALYFRRKAPSLENTLEILAQPALRQVVMTAIGMPAAAAGIQIDRQVALINERIDIEDFTDSEKLDAFLNRFAIMWDQQNPSQVPQTALVQIGQPAPIGLSSQILESLQSLKLGGR